MDDIRYISVMDEAIDRSRSRLKGRENYEGTHDRSCLVMLPGKSPVVFVLKPLDFHGRRFVNGADSADIRAIRACIYGLESIEGYAPYAPRAWRGTMQLKLANGTRMIWHDEEIAEVEETFGTPLIHELSSVLMQRTERGKAWGGNVRPYTLPPYLWDVLADLAPQGAA